MPVKFKAILRNFATFAGVGVIATGLQYIILVLLVSGFGMPPALSSGLGYIAGAVVSYWLNYFVTFKSNRGHLGALARFGTVAALGLSLNIIIVKFGTEDLHMHYALSQVFATAIVMIWNYVANKFWTYQGVDHGK